MLAPEIPVNESARLKALDSYNIVDTLPETAYDDITKIASMICNMPIALVTLIDEKRQFFKSRHGLDASETHRDFAFCAHAINHPNEMLIVKNALNDERFSDNPFVTGNPNVIFYAGMPLVNPEGYALGTLCVIDNKPNDLTEEQKDALKSLSNQVTYVLELRRKNDLLEKSQQNLALHAKEMETFAYAASHDLKEPLRMVKSFSTLLGKKYSSTMDETGKKFLYQISDGAARMEVLTNDLLQYALAGRNDTEIIEIDISQIIEEVKQLYRLVIAENSVSFEATELPVIKASANGLKQLFQNLIGNAIKYQLAGTKPVIKISATETNSHWQFMIADNGIGMEPENLDIIFEIFKRLHTKTTYSGTGIGLSICKKIVEEQGGKIWVTSEKDKGSCFYFTILKN